LEQQNKKLSTNSKNKKLCGTTFQKKKRFGVDSLITNIKSHTLVIIICLKKNKVQNPKNSNKKKTKLFALTFTKETILKKQHFLCLYNHLEKKRKNNVNLILGAKKLTHGFLMAVKDH
jgi:hypothetical protein